MQVDFEISRSRKYRVASAVRTGPYTGEKMMRPYFSRIKKWMDKSGLESGVWIFRSLEEEEVPDEKMRFEAAIEIRGRGTKIRPPEGIVVSEIPGGTVARVRFDPSAIADRVIYHGLESWLEWRKRYGEYERHGPTREVYTDDPWTSKKAWKNIEIQVPLVPISKK